MNSTLEVFNIGKKYKNRPVLRNVSLNVRRGEAVGLLGPNGAGKTTCFYCVTGLITPDYGDVHIDGQDITNLPMYRRARMGIGYLPQEASIFRSLSVEDNIKAILEIVIDDESQRENMLEELLSEFSIAHLRKSPAIALSGGERRRLEIARALASQPNFILLDEPLAGIDPIAVSEIRNLVSQLKHRGLGVLITDHNVRETLDITDRAYILHGGTVLMEGNPEEIVANHLSTLCNYYCIHLGAKVPSNVAAEALDKALHCPDSQKVQLQYVRLISNSDVLNDERFRDNPILKSAVRRNNMVVVEQYWFEVLQQHGIDNISDSEIIDDHCSV